MVGYYLLPYYKSAISIKLTDSPFRFSEFIGALGTERGTQHEPAPKTDFLAVRNDREAICTVEKYQQRAVHFAL